MAVSCKGMRVFVTGGTGFIGSHVVKELLSEEAKIVIPYIAIDKKSFFSVDGLSKKVVLVQADITNKQKMLEVIKKYKIDYIFHLAAQTTVTQAYNDPFETLITNIVGTINILESIRVGKSVKGVIVASSDKAYGKTKTTYREDSPLKGDHPYDVSKTCADYISQTYFKTYRTPIVITRFGNVYGEGDVHYDRIIPGICEAILKKKILQVRSDGSYVRDYMYVRDVAKGYLTLLKHFDTIQGEAYNFSSKDTLSVIELIKKSEKI